jgi:hypothetical protein
MTASPALENEGWNGVLSSRWWRSACWAELRGHWLEQVRRRSSGPPLPCPPLHLLSVFLCSLSLPSPPSSPRLSLSLSLSLSSLSLPPPAHSVAPPSPAASPPPLPAKRTVAQAALVTPPPTRSPHSGPASTPSRDSSRTRRRGRRAPEARLTRGSRRLPQRGHGL